MKKYIALVVSMIFVLGFAASAFAIHAEIPSETTATVAKGSTLITLGGELRVRGEIQKNTDFNDDTNAGDSSAYDQRVRLSVTAAVTPNTMGQITLESNNGTDVNDNVTWGAPVSGAKGVYAQGNAKKGDLRILEGWILTKGSGLLGIPSGLKIGHMPLALGNKLFFDHTKFGDDAIVFFMDPTKEMHVGFLTIKFNENTNAAADDSDAYVGLMTYKFSKDSSMSFDATYVNDMGNLLGGLVPGADVHFWNFGLRGDAKIAGFGIKGDIELQTGKITDLGATDDQKFKGIAALVGLSYKLDPVTLSLDAAYGSGDNDDDNDFETFVTSLGADQHYTYVYEYRTANAAGNANGGLANTTYIKLGADMGLMKDMNASLNAYYLRASKKNVNGDKGIGTEIDAKVTYKIDKNLNYWVEGGYLFAGNFYDAAKDADNAYAVRHGIQLNF